MKALIKTDHKEQETTKENSAPEGTISYRNGTYLSNSKKFLFIAMV